MYCQEVQTWSSRFMRILPVPFHKAAHTLGSQQQGPSPSEMFLPPKLSSLLTSISCSTLLVVTNSRGCVCPPSPPAPLALSSHLLKLGLLTQRLIASGLRAGRADRKTPPCLPSSKHPHPAERNAPLASSSENKAPCWAQRRERQHIPSINPPSPPKTHGMKDIIASWSSIGLQTAPEEASLRFLSLQPARSPV